jgi:hypothetical protein
LTGTRTYTAGCTIIYNRSTAQFAGNGLTADCSVQIDNANGVSLSGATSMGNLTLASGDLSIGANTLTLNGTVTTAGGSLTGGTTSSITCAGSTALTLPAVSGGLKTLTVNNSGGVAIGGAITLNDSANAFVLTSGAVTGAGNLTLASGATLKRDGGSLDATPAGTGYNVTYTTTTGGVTTGPEFPNTPAVQNVTFSNSSGTNTLGGNVTINGNLTTTAGGTVSDGGFMLTFKGANLNNNSTLASVGSGKLLIAGSSTQTLNAALGAIYGNVEVSNTSATVYLSAANSFAVNSPDTFTIDSGTTVQSQNKAITGTGNFAIQAGATLVVGDGTGINPSGSGVIQVSGTRTFDPAANYVIRGFNGNCSMGTGFPTTVNNLTIDLTASNLTATLQSPVTVNGNLALTTGTLDISSGGTLLANGTSTGAGAVTVSGGSLRGIGAVNGPVTVGVGGAVQPGAGSIGTLTLAAAPTLGGTVLARLNTANAQTADKLTVAGGALNYGGTLALTNVGPALTSGQVFTLFDAPAYSGAFGSITPGGTAHWNTNNLIVNGTLTFTNTQPVARPVTNMVAQGESIIVTNNPGKNAFATDADLDSLTFAVVGGPAVGTVSNLPGGFVYTSTGAASNSWDSFQYAVDDGYGGAATNTIALYIGSPLGANLISSTASGGLAYLTYAGVPEHSYVSERATNLIPPIVWTPVATNTAGSTTSAFPGRIFFTNEIISPASFFRTQPQ